jgi:hypothetical protein
MRAGVIDPAKVVRTALQNAASIASLMLTTEALVSCSNARPEFQISFSRFPPEFKGSLFGETALDGVSCAAVTGC